MTRPSPICTTCNDTGAVKGPGGVDACPDCALEAERDYRVAKQYSEQQAARAVRRGKKMDRAA